ncbi:T9SS type A sorting domain-containing protein [Flavobacterium sp. SM2513]|uniref:T9SS type A sorting domain-containing protein n=1 Tax=Flavobacterium sp. SM2513 TaxID=3424766 RepID=UPI003D7F1FAC
MRKYSLYPNPAKHQITIQLESVTTLKSVNIYNNAGQLVLKSKKTTINTSRLASGSYIILIETSKGKGYKKLILE